MAFAEHRWQIPFSKCWRLAFGLHVLAVCEIPAEGLVRQLQGTCSGPQTVQELVDSVTTSYDKTARPGHVVGGQGDPTQVKVQVYISSIPTVNEKAQSVVISGYFRTYWDDPRVAFSSREDGGCFNELNCPAEHEGRFWQPDIYFDNSVSEWYGAGLLAVSPTGSIWKSTRMKHTFECPMHFARLPFDEQTCTMILASYSQYSTDVEVVPKPDASGSPNGIVMSDTYCGPTAWDIVEVTSWSEVRQFSAGPWTYVHLKIRMKRLDKFHVRNSILNSVFFVICAWASFFIAPGIAPARVGITCIAMLTLRNLLGSVNSSLPPIPYTTWLTGYLFACMIFCVSAVFEYGIVSWLMAVEKQKEQRLVAVRALRFSNWADPVDNKDGAEGTLLKVIPTGDDKSDQDALAKEQLKVAHVIFLGKSKQDANAVSIRKGLRRFGKYHTEAQVGQMLNKFDTGSKGLMDEKGFLKFMQELDKLCPSPIVEHTLVSHFFNQPPFQQVDHFMRYFFISVFFIFSVCWFASVEAFPATATTSDGQCVG